MCVFFFSINQTRKSYGESQNVRHRKELSQEKRVLSKLLKDRKVCNRAVLMREEQPGTEMIWAPRTPGRQEGDFCPCLNSKVSVTSMG